MSCKISPKELLVSNWRSDQVEAELNCIPFPPGDLYSRKRYSEAARVMLDYLDDADGAVGALVQGNEISEALRIVRVPPFTLSHEILTI
jgi:hypothetical protein